MSSEMIQTWFPVIAWLFGLAGLCLALWFRVTAREEANAAIAESEAAFTRRFAEYQLQINGLKADIEELEETAVQHSNRLVAVEKGLEAFPTVRDIAKLYDKLNELAQSVSSMAANVDGLKDGQKRTEVAIGVINETLMQRSGG